MAATFRARKLALSAAVLALSVGAPELVLRLVGFDYPPVDVPMLVWNPVEDKKLAAEDALHRNSVRQLWEPRPSAEIPGARGERVNAAAFRGQVRPEAKPAGAVRVVLLGDSSTFGFGLPYEDTYAAQLEALLLESGMPAEVLDLGVIGYTIRQGIERYRELGRPYAPDVVVAAFGAVNEHHLAGGFDDETKIARNVERANWHWRTARWARESSRLLHAAAWVADQRHGGRQAIRMRVYRKFQLEAAAFPRMGQVECEGTPRVSLDQFDEYLERLRREVEADGARLVLVSMPRRPIFERDTPVMALYTERLEAYAARSGVTRLDARAAFADPDVARAPVHELFLPGDPVHPSRLGHAVIARGLARLILEPDRPSVSPPEVVAAEPGATATR